MRLVRRAVEARPTPDSAFLLLDARAREKGLASPAALSGVWFASRAVLVPSWTPSEVDPASAFAVPARQPDVRDAVSGAIGGGWLGYLSYDLIDASRRRSTLPKAVWGWVDHLLRLDADGQWWFEALIPDDASAPDELADELASLLTREPPPAEWTATELRRPLATDHRDAVKACVHAIEAGELFQANICSRFAGDFTGSPTALFAEGIRRMAPRRAAYLAGEWGAVVSMSPELFLARQGDLIHSTPIKGTLPRRGAADDVLARKLRESAKDVAENVMITDLVRNDLGRVCEVGSVRVPDLLSVRAAPGVWHLESTVEGRLAAGLTDEDLLRATFPPGSVTGAPKIRALDLIAELEPTARGVYTGAIGLVSPLAGLELNVAIRTLELHGGQVELGVGGGITADSDPELEWQECLHKAAPLEKLLTTPPSVQLERSHL
jgi:para-aminobenzoate synthetase component 1